jgi:hypothetical protein
MKTTVTCTRAIIIKPGIFTSMQLDFINESTEETFTKYFNTKGKATKNICVTVNSDFAKLYRLTFGVNPKPRFSRAKQLMKHFLGSAFQIEYTASLHMNAQQYNKIIDIEPINPIVNAGEWYKSGMLIVKKYERKVRAKPYQTDTQKRGNYELKGIKKKLSHP